MNEAWSGSVLINDPVHTVEGLQLWSSLPQSQSLIAGNARLHFLALVHIPSIPLYLAAGPSFEVSTDDHDTTQWLNDNLLGQQVTNDIDDVLDRPWWLESAGQSEQGILLRVEDGDSTNVTYNGITEILLFASVTVGQEPLPTPPRSSSPAPPRDSLLNGTPDGSPAIKVYALPLSSNIVKQVKEYGPKTTPRPEQSASQACFLPCPAKAAPTEQKTHRKRQNLSSLFDDATQKRRKIKGRGGESIAQAMASLDRPASQQGLLPFNDNESQESLPVVAPKKTSRAGLTRANTIAGSEMSRRTSRSGSLANGKRSSLHRVESAISPRGSPTFSDADDNLAQQNKAILTKIVMAAMRLYGLQSKKKPNTMSKTASDVGSVANDETEDEYKLVYHQVFKAASFAFRKHLHNRIIEQEMMRDVVDKFLGLFCNDPLTAANAQEADSFGFGSQGSDGHGAFDKPSGKHSSPAQPTTWGTPTIKKR